VGTAGEGRLTADQEAKRLGTFSRKVGKEVDDIVEGGEAGDDEGGDAVGQVIQDDGLNLCFAEIMGESLRFRPLGDLSNTSLDIYLIIEKA